MRVRQDREIGEILPLQQRNAHDLEVAGRHRIRQRLVRRGLVARPAFDADEARGQAMDVERHRGRDCGTANSGKSAQLRQQHGGETPHAGLVDRPAGQIVFGEQYTIADESRIDAACGVEVSKEQPRDQQHHHGERHLGCHQDVPHPAARLGVRARAQVLRSDTRELQRRGQTEDDRAGDAEQHRDRQARSIHAGLERDGDPSHAHLRQRIQRPRSPNRHAGAERRATQGEHEAFGQEQLRDAPRLRAERQTNRHFLAPGARPRQQQIGGVAADRKQQQERDALEDDERGGEETLRTAWRLPERQHVRLHGGVGLRERSRQLPHDAGDFVLRTCLARVRREPTDDRVAANRSVFQLTRPGEEQW